jgi:RNA-directed DNA polymerase
MRWGKRRHPRKTGGWVYGHYWKTLNSRKEFYAAKNGVTHSLSVLSDVKIIRHKKVKGDYNPFDPTDFAYAESLRSERMTKEIRDKTRLKLWLSQLGRCAVCDQVMDMEESIDDHHIVYRQFGGSDALSNRVLLHPVCHRRVHALGLEVTKPVPA